MLRNGGPNFFSLRDEVCQETEMQKTATFGSFQASLIATIRLAGQTPALGKENDGL
jgi:hypothetical protein